MIKAAVKSTKVSFSQHFDMLFASIFRWFMSHYIEWHVCQQFCAFKKAGSALRYTHVHLLTPNNGKATGLGHDDETEIDHEAHAAIGDEDGTRTQAENDESKGLRKFTWMTAYFHQGTADGECDEGFSRVKCKCSGGEGQSEEVWVCYTLDHDTFTRWYESIRWTHQTGRYAYPYTGVGRDPSTFRLQRLPCNSSIVLRTVEFTPVTNCDGWGGPGDGENQLVQTARASLQQAFARISCEGNCVKTKVETFRGWKCGQTPHGQEAEAVVQWTVTCKRP